MERHIPKEIKICEHRERRDYCLEEARDRDGDAALVIEALDAILYDEDDFVRGGFQHSSIDNLQTLERHFTHLANETAGDGGIAFFDHDVVISHSYDKALDAHRYDIATSWDTMGSQADTGYQLDYAIDVYREGNVQAAITEPDLRTELFKPDQPLQYATREMTPYDYDQLFAVLAQICEARYAQLDEDRRIDAHWS